MQFHGSIRIKKARTLQSWIDKGWYQREIDNGYTFAIACGRFRIGQCECSRCVKPNGGWEKKAVLERNGILKLTNNIFNKSKMENKSTEQKPSITNKTNLSNSLSKCPECLKPTSEDELKMFGGLCEECSGAFD